MNVVANGSIVRCEFTVKAPIERVWAALTTKEGWESWFSQGVTSDFQVGSPLIMDWGSGGTSNAVVSARKDMTHFAYRWHPGCTIADEVYHDDEMTEVAFELKSVEGGTSVTMVESGFDRVPMSRRAAALKDNSAGWDEELGHLVAWVDDGETPSRK